MPAGRKVGEVYYEVTADNQVRRGLAAAEGEVQAFKEAVNAVDARIEVEADLSELKKDAAEIKAFKEAMEHDKIQIDVEIKDLEDLQALEKTTRAQDRHLEDLYKHQDRYNRALRQNAAAAKQVQQQTTVRQDELRRIDRAIKQERERGRAIDSTAAAIRRRSDLTAKERLEVAKLEEQYARLYTRRRKVDRLDPGISSPREKLLQRRIDAERELVAARLREFGHTREDLDRLDVDLANNRFSWRRLGQTIAETRIHMGFFSTTLRGLLVILGTLGPIILSVAGSLGALVSVLGAGILGAATVGVAGLTGFGLAATGAYLALKPAIDQIGAAFKATKALSDAQLKYGKDSSQAKDKQEQLNHTLKGMTPAAREAFQSIAGMRTEFDRLAGRGIRRDFFNSFAEGVKTAKALLPTFANESRRTFHVAAEGVNEWLRGLRSPEARRGLADLMANFRRGLGPLMEGLGNIGTILGRLAVAGSHFLPQLNRGFREWSQNLEDSLGTGDRLVARVGRWVTAMQKVGHFTQAASQALGTFFGLGLGPGENLLDSMTRSLQRWNDEMERNPGRVQKFFGDAVTLMKQLGPALGRFLMTLAHASETLGPFVEGATAAFNQLFDVLSNFGTIWFQVAGGIWAVNKALKVFTGINLLRGGIGALLGAGGGATAGGLLGRLFGGGRGVRQAEQATRQLTLFGREAAGVGAILAPEIVIPLAAAGVAVYGLARALGSVRSPTERFNDSLKELSQNERVSAQTAKTAAEARQRSNKLWERANQLTKEGRDSSKQFIQTVRQAAAADKTAATAQQAHNDALEKSHKNLADATAALDDQRSSIKGAVAAGRGYGHAVGEEGAKATEELATRLRLATLNFHRVQAGAKTAGPAILKSLNAIKQVAGRSTALKFRFADQNVLSGLAKVSSKLKGLGRQREVIEILADSKNAEQAFARLRKLLNTVQGKTVKVDAHDSASPVAQRVKARIAAIHDKLIRLDLNDQGATAKAAALRAQIAALQDKTIHINYIETRTLRTYGSRPGARPYTGGIMVPGYQEGGWVERMMERAYARADQRAAQRSDPGGKITSPRYIVGEQAPRYNEFIITENPRYRESNLWYLEQAARALGTTLEAVPGFATGKGAKKSSKRKKRGHKKKGGGLTVQTYGSSLSDLQEPGSAYDLAEQDANFAAQVADLTRSKYDLNLVSLSAVTSSLQKEINAYSHLAGVIDSMLVGNPVAVKSPPDPPVRPKKPKKWPKDKDAREKAQKKYEKDLKFWQNQMDIWEKSKENAEEHNQAISDRYALADERRTIRNITIPSLQLDIYEAQNAAAEKSALGQTTANLTRYNTFKQYAGNLIPASIFPVRIPSSGLGSGSSVPSLTGAAPTTVLSSAAAEARSSGGTTAGLSGPSGTQAAGGDTIINLNQEYKTMPEDPHTYTQGVLFEIGAATA